MKAKEAIRKKIWTLLQEKKASRFPGAEGRIPNFVGAERCARILAESPLWKNAKVVKVNPDSPQRAIRQKALEEGKIVYMAVPRLRSEKPFIELDSKKIDCSPYQASSIKGAAQYGRPVSLREVTKIDLVVCGSVAVDGMGGRLGKGGGYSDLEYGLLREEKKVDASTPIVTSVHPLQLVTDKIPMTKHDIPLNAVVTPEKMTVLESTHAKPKGIYWHLLPDEKIDEIPVLSTRKKSRT